MPEPHDSLGRAMSDVNAANPELDALRRRLRIEWLRGEWARTLAFGYGDATNLARRLNIERRLYRLGVAWPGATGHFPEPPELEGEVP